MRRFILTAAPPALAAFGEWHFGDQLHPHLWYPFYPALFISSWLGDWRSSILTTCVTVLYVWWALIPAVHSFALSNRSDLFGIVSLLGTGVLFTVFHERLHRTNRRLEETAAQRRIFAALIDNSPDFIGIADPAGTPIYLNPAGRRMVGLSPDFPVERTAVADYYASSQRQFALDVILPSMSAQSRWEGETAFRHWQTEDAIPVSDTHFTIREPASGRLLGHGTITRDITELKRAREEVKAANDRLAAIAHASVAVSEAIGALPESSVRAVLETIARHSRLLTGAEFAAVGIGGGANQPIDAWVFDGVEPDVATRIGRVPRLIGLLAAVAESNESIRLRDLRADPRFRGFPPHHPAMTTFLGVPIRYRGSAVGHLYLANKANGLEFTSEDQRIVEMLADRVGVAVETARLYAAEGMQRAWLQGVVDQMPEGIALMDAAGRVVLESRFLRSLSLSEPLGRDQFGNAVTVALHRTSGEPVRAEELPLVKAFARRETTHGAEFVVRSADGRSVPVLVSAGPAWRTNGELVGAVVIMQDISALKTLERLREEWAAIVAHDLRQPINAIVLRSDLLLRTTLTDKQRDGIWQVRGIAMRLNRMVNDLTDASQLEARRMRMTPVRLDLSALMRQVAVHIPDAATRIALRLPRDHALFVQGDAQRIEQVMVNLLSNAIKYGDAGTDIVIELREHEQEAEVVVINSGRGIPPDELPRLFDRYVRSRTVAHDGPAGLGLGLYIAKGLIEAHGGRIWAESVPNQTTAFHFTIPLDGPPVPLFLLTPTVDAPQTRTMP